jgi:hypothetical protein
MCIQGRRVKSQKASALSFQQSYTLFENGRVALASALTIYAGRICVAGSRGVPDQSLAESRPLIWLGVLGDGR